MVISTAREESQWFIWQSYRLTGDTVRRNFGSRDWGVPHRIEVLMAKQTMTKQKVTFSLMAPSAQSVQLAGDFTGWQQAPLPMKKLKSGLWKTTVNLTPGRYEYRLLVDGQWCDDPECNIRQTNPLGGENCVCVVQQPVE